MARSVASDFLQSMRFHVNVVHPQGLDLRSNPAGGGSQPQAGFNNVTAPEATVENVEYREGTMIYTRKQPGNPSISDITLQRGVTRGDSSFWDWLRCVIEGSGEYRADLEIKHFHREQALTRRVATDGSVGREANLTNINVEKPARIYRVYEAFPIRHKVAGDLDATSSDISLMEIDVSCEHFEVEEVQ